MVRGMDKDYRPWWLKGAHIADFLFGVEMGKYSMWCEHEPDDEQYACMKENYWAIHVGLAEPPR